MPLSKKIWGKSLVSDSVADFENDLIGVIIASTNEWFAVDFVGISSRLTKMLHSQKTLNVEHLSGGRELGEKCRISTIIVFEWLFQNHTKYIVTYID